MDDPELGARLQDFGHSLRVAAGLNGHSPVPSDPACDAESAREYLGQQLRRHVGLGGRDKPAPPRKAKTFAPVAVPSIAWQQYPQSADADLADQARGSCADLADNAPEEYDHDVRESTLWHPDEDEGREEPLLPLPAGAARPDPLGPDARPEPAPPEPRRAVVHTTLNKLIGAVRGDTSLAKTMMMRAAHEAANRRLNALLSFCTDMSCLENGDVDDIIMAICQHSLALFNCERCTFFVVDHLSEELLGWYLLNGEMNKIRVPKAGVVALAIDSCQTINIVDAWNDDRFSKETDKRTGFRTRSILCEPLSTEQGKVIAVVQCINKIDGAFDDQDIEAFSVVSRMLENMIKHHLGDASEEALLQRTDITDDVKDIYLMTRLGDVTTVTARGQRGGLPIPGYGPQPGTPSHAPGGLAVPGAASLAVPGAASLAVPGAARDVRRSCYFAPAKVGSTKARRFLQWELDYDALDHASLCDHALFPFEHWDLATVLMSTMPAIEHFVKNLEGKYCDNPYHNFTHAFSTLHVTTLLLIDLVPYIDEERLQARQELDGAVPASPRAAPPSDPTVSDLDRVAVLLAAIGHDVGHRGRTNAFEVNCETDLAIRYNDQTVLENHHASVTCSLALDLLADLPVADKKRVKLLLVKAILATDMAAHGEQIKFVKSWKASVQCDDTALLGVLLHCADLGHPSMPWSTHFKTSLKICTEFYNQFCEEEERGLPALPFMGHPPDGPLDKFAGMQTGFISFVAAPMWAALNDGVAGRIKYIITNIERNKENWEKIKNGESVDMALADAAFVDSPYVAAVLAQESQAGPVDHAASAPLTRLVF